MTVETRTPEPMRPGQPARHDYEYKRNGTAALFMLFAPLEGWRHLEVMERRTAIDYAKILRDLSDSHSPHAEKIVLVQDNLNTHAPSSLYEAFEPAEARRLIERFEWHYSPKHGSWLNLQALVDRTIDGYVAPSRAKHATADPGKCSGGKTSGPLTQAMRIKIDDGGFETPYRLRKQIVEPVFGQIKQARGFRQFPLRGLEKVRAEWAMIYLAHNLCKLYTRANAA